MLKMVVRAICAGVMIAFGLVGAPAAHAEVPILGIGLALGEAGTLGVSARIRPFDHLQIEAGAGAYVWIVSDGDSTETGVVPAFSSEVLYMFNDRQSPGQHGIGVLLSIEEVRGTLFGAGYRYERYFGQGRTGFHVDIGLLLGSDVEEHAKDFFVEETDFRRSDIDVLLIPISLKLGFHF